MTGMSHTVYISTTLVRGHTQYRVNHRTPPFIGHHRIVEHSSPVQRRTSLLLGQTDACSFSRSPCIFRISMN